MERLRKNAGFMEALFYMAKCAFIITVMSIVLKEIGEVMK